MEIKKYVFSHFGQNTYLIYGSDKKAALIDAGCLFKEEREQLAAFIRAEGLELEQVLYTHCHLDHAFGALFVSQEFPGVKFLAHADEKRLIEGAVEYAGMYGISMEQPPAIDSFISHGGTVHVGGIQLQAIHVPGHSPGSICYYSEESSLVFTGDVLFHRSIGRTDLPGGNHQQLLAGINSKLYSLPKDTAVLPGHGQYTSIGEEIASNPFTL
jgi:hydroxyacylglutathione hydrolase